MSFYTLYLSYDCCKIKSLECGAQAAQYAEGLQKLIPQLGYLSKILPPAVLQWKLELLKQGNAVVKPLLPNIQQRVFLLAADNDLLIPSKQEGPRLKNLLPRCRLKASFCVCVSVCVDARVCVRVLGAWLHWSEPVARAAFLVKGHERISDTSICSYSLLTNHNLV